MNRRAVQDTRTSIDDDDDAVEKICQTCVHWNRTRYMLLNPCGRGEYYDAQCECTFLAPTGAPDGKPRWPRTDSQMRCGQWGPFRQRRRD